MQVKLLHEGMDGILLQEIGLDNPYIKDFDKTPEGGLLEWASHFELSNWGFFLAIENSIPVGAAAVEQIQMG